MLVAVYENQKYSTFLAPLEKKGEIENFFKENNIEWYTMSYSEGEKRDVKLLEKCN
mgnify:CR=1 FL=1